jgi:hypothetical protein
MRRPPVMKIPVMKIPLFVVSRIWVRPFADRSYGLVEYEAVTDPITCPHCSHVGKRWARSAIDPALAALWQGGGGADYVRAELTLMFARVPATCQRCATVLQAERVRFDVEIPDPAGVAVPAPPA